MILQLIGVALGGIILWRIQAMNQKLTDAINDLNAEVADSKGKLASILTFVEGTPALVAAAVAQALADNDVEETQAADSIEAARQTMSDNVDGVLSAIDQNPAPGEEASGATVASGSGEASGSSDTSTSDTGSSTGDTTGEPTPSE
jgi:hypothetical protein